MGRRLVVLGCSATKLEVGGMMPAIGLYDGPCYRVLRKFLCDHCWPTDLSIAVLSARHGLIGGLSHIATYDDRMTFERATKLSPAVTSALARLLDTHASIELILGKDYVRSIGDTVLRSEHAWVRVVEGSIGMKQSRLRSLLHSLSTDRRETKHPVRRAGRPLYFLPDWDDFLDVDFDFAADAFSNPERSKRRQEHSIGLMRPARLCDGVLVSLAQHLGSKGLLKRVAVTDEESLAPRTVRAHFKLEENQWTFGDCGAFSYVAEPEPTISVEQAVSLYSLYEFDFGASVDHIPVPYHTTPLGRIELSPAEQRRRVHLTRTNAERFIALHRERRSKFIPVGIIQGLSPEDFARQLPVYSELGYDYIALGGLVPRSDAEVLTIVEAVAKAAATLRRKPWVHLFGVFRPQLQRRFRELGIGSFDSATYFRKAWLRSDQNYLGVDGEWYAAIRVPPTSDPRTMSRLRASGKSEQQIRQLERTALDALRSYELGHVDVDECLNAVLAYDSLLIRAGALDQRLLMAYRRTLEERPWKACYSSVCQSLGIDVLIFRGLNRNKRRGAHNTLLLYKSVMAGG